MTVAQTRRVKNHRPQTLKQLDAEALERLAYHYVARYATTRAKLSSYLARKIKQRGCEITDVTLVMTIVTKMADLGFVNDSAYAEMKTGALLRRGYGARPTRRINSLNRGSARNASSSGSTFKNITPKSRSSQARVSQVKADSRSPSPA